MKKRLAYLFSVFLFAAPPLTSIAQDAASYAAERAALESTKKQALTDLLQQQLREAQASLDEKTRARNPTGMATYSEAVALLEVALKDVQAQGDFTPPQSWRKPLESMIAAVKEGRQAQLDIFTKAMADMDARYPPEARVAPAPAPEKPVESPAAAVTATNLQPAAEAPTGMVLNLTMKASGPVSSDPDIFAQRGSATVWRSIGRWTASMQSEALLSIPVFNQQGDTVGSYTNPATRAISTWRFSPTEILPPGPYPLRLRRIKDHSVVDIESWPGEGVVGQNLAIRTRRGRWPVAHAFDVETAGETAPTQDQLVSIPISSSPPGALVLVNGAGYRVNGVPVTTPCRITLPSGIAPEIRLRLSGAKDFIASRFRVEPGAQIGARFDRPPAAPSIMVQVDPTKEWLPTKIVLKPDQRARFVVEGRWQIGSRRDPCTYEGYPDTPANSAYYKDGIAASAKEPKYPYGALLYRIGERGMPTPVRMDQPADTLVGGTLFFDVNELSGRTHRGDNSGMLTVRVTIESL